MKGVIISNSSDISTDKVCHWINNLNPHVEIIRIDTDLQKASLSIKLKDNVSTVDINDIDISQLKFLWFRRGFISVDIPFLPTIGDTIIKYLDKEHNLFLDSALKIIQDKKFVLGSYYSEKYNNRLVDFFYAQKYGLKTPESIITSLRSELYSFHNKYEKVITKPIGNNINSVENGKVFFGKTFKLIEEEDFVEMPDIICPTLFQQYIDKEYDIRIFYLRGDFYSMAILSQKDDSTKFDYRNHKSIRQNRVVPYDLPKILKKKLSNFLKNMNLDTASIDLVKCSKTSQYYFLDLNPQGQFDWMSTFCGFNIEFEIAKILING